jgi:hypothetical protein
MVESVKSTPNEALRGAIDQALRSGMDAGEIADMVAECTVNLQHMATDDLAADTPHKGQGDVRYEPGELPEGLIDLPSAAKKYGIPGSTLRNWVQRRKLPRCGRLRARADGGGYIVTEEAAIDRAIAS